MLENLWTTFRSLPGWAQVLGWLLLWPAIAALFLWRRPSTGKTYKIVAVAVLLFGSIAYAGILSPTPGAKQTGPSSSESGSSVIPPRSPTPTPSPSPSPSIQLSPSPQPSATVTGSHPTQGIPQGAQKARVAKNVDGDTIWADPLEAGSLAFNATHKIRILEIDTPEIYGGTVECYGPEASAFAKQQIPTGSVVYLLGDKEDKDRYGRFLRYVWRESGAFYNDMAVRTGHAKAVLYMPNDLYIDQMRAAETEAQANKRGLWGACSDGTSSEGTAAPPPPPSGSDCHASYPDFCIAPPPPDKNCADFTQKSFTVRWDVPDPDPHKLDGNKDGKACEG